MVTEMHKLTTSVDGSAVPVRWPHVFARERTTGPDRLVIVPREDPIGLLGELAEWIGPEYFLLYVLVVQRGEAPAGRYESPPLELVDVRIFLEEFGRLLECDARHQFWIGSTSDRGMVVYDDHGILYAYGPLEDFQRTLLARQFQPGSFSIPAPHTHHYHAELDAEVARLLGRFEWVRTELRPEDEG